jgi:CheY-like chemotaxis protein
MALILRFRLNPSPRGLNHTDHDLPAGMNMGMLDRYLLLALAALTIERVEQHGLSPGKLVGLAQVFASPLKRLLAKSFFHCPVGTSPDPEELRRVQQLTTEAPMVAKTVLVVEDDPSIRIVAEEMFVAAGFEVESVQRADHALDIVAQRSEQTAFLFTDVQTPGPIDGIDLARLVKTHWPHVEVLVTSGRPVSNIVLPCGVRFISKPWSHKEVLELSRAAVTEQ